MAETNRADAEIFDGGPPLRLEKSLGLIKPNERRSVQRAMLAVLIVWAPLFVLSAIESLVLKENKLGSLIGDLTALSRYLIVAPLFILAEGSTISRIGQISSHFIDAGIVTARDLPRFDAIIADARRLLNSASVELGVVVLAYLAMIILMRVFPDQDIPLWHKAGDGGKGLFLGGLVARAGERSDLSGAAAGLVMADSYLGAVSFSGLPSRSSADGDTSGPGRRAAICQSVRACLSRAELRYQHERRGRGGLSCPVPGQLFFSFIYVIAAVVILNLLLFAAPLLVFGGKLVEARRRGIIDYGGLAGAVGSQLEKKWRDYRKTVNEGALDVPHFSATTDLYQVVSNVYQMKAFPIDTQDLIALIVVTLLPFLPALLFEIPVDEIFSDLVKVDVLAACRRPPALRLVLDQGPIYSL